MNSVKLERIDIDDVATDPHKIAAEIHRQLGDIPGPIPVAAIARALDIEEIRIEPLNNVEGMLVTKAERDFGTILLNSSSSSQRRTYSLAHELGHFLCAWHQPTTNKDFRCSHRDMSAPLGNANHIKQEQEANQFAIELLAPLRLVRPFLRRLPDLEHVLAIRQTLHISKTAAVRRYVELHNERLAVIFARNGEFLYTVRGHDEFPWIPFSKGDRLPILPSPDCTENTSEMVMANARDWLGRDNLDLSLQLLQQEDGYSIILLHLAELS